MNESNPTPDANPEQDRLLDLLADHALGELSPAELQEMNTLLEGHPELQDDALEEAAALLLVAETVEASGSGFDDEYPAGLGARLIADAERFATQAQPQGPVTPVPVSAKPRRSSSVLAFIGGLATAAAMIALYFGVMMAAVKSDPPPTASSYAQFMQSTPDVATHLWAITEAGYEQVTGEVAWSGATQNGYMVLDGLPVNDPDVAQYQLWIVDPTRDEFPVDGGVFNVVDHVAEDGKAYVPIDAKLRVDQPAAFAITLEKPGGVVKSNNALLVVAAVE